LLILYSVSWTIGKDLQPSKRFVHYILSPKILDQVYKSLKEDTEVRKLQGRTTREKLVIIYNPEVESTFHFNDAQTQSTSSEALENDTQQGNVDELCSCN